MKRGPGLCRRRPRRYAGEADRSVGRANALRQLPVEVIEVRVDPVGVLAERMKTLDSPPFVLFAYIREEGKIEMTAYQLEPPKRKRGRPQWRRVGSTMSVRDSWRQCDPAMFKCSCRAPVVQAAGRFCADRDTGNTSEIRS